MIVAGPVLFSAGRAAAQPVVYGLTTGTPAQEIISFQYVRAPGNPQPLLSAHPITGLDADESLFKFKAGRPGTFYAMTSKNTIVSVESNGQVMGGLYGFPFPLNGTTATFAIEPNSLIRSPEGVVVTNLGQTFHFIPGGLLAGGPGTLTYAPGQAVQGTPEILDVAFGPGPSPTLFGIDARTYNIVRIGDPGDPFTNGTQVTLLGAANFGNQGGVPGPTAGFDIAPDGAGYLSDNSRAFEPAFVWRQAYRFTSTGVVPDPLLAAYSVAGDIGTGVPLLSIVVPEPTCLGLLMSVGLLRRRRKA